MVYGSWSCLWNLVRRSTHHAHAAICEKIAWVPYIGHCTQSECISQHSVRVNLILLWGAWLWLRWWINVRCLHNLLLTVLILMQNCSLLIKPFNHLLVDQLLVFVLNLFFVLVLLLLFTVFASHTDPSIGRLKLCGFFNAHTVKVNCLVYAAVTDPALIDFKHTWVLVCLQVLVTSFTDDCLHIFLHLIFDFFHYIFPNNVLWDHYVNFLFAQWTRICDVSEPLGDARFTVSVVTRIKYDFKFYRNFFDAYSASLQLPFLAHFLQRLTIAFYSLSNATSLNA